MREFTFVTGNDNKAQYLAKLLGLPVKHRKVDVDEIQTTNIEELVAHKARLAFEAIGSPVLVEDQSLKFTALGGLPGPFIKFFIEDAGIEACCKILDGFSDRSAYAECTFGYYDGKDFKLFTSGLAGSIAENPRGSGGYGWDPIFIPEGYDRTRAELTEAEDHEVYLRIKPIAEVREFLTSK